MLRTLGISTAAHLELTYRGGSLGSLLAASGVAISARAGRALTIGESTGLEGRLYIGGLYRYTRNPQYVGILIAVGGFTLLTNSVRFAMLAVGSALWTLLLPFAEGLWLEEQYGERYETYRERVPRFIGGRLFGLYGDNGTALMRCGACK